MKFGRVTAEITRVEIVTLGQYGKNFHIVPIDYLKTYCIDLSKFSDVVDMSVAILKAQSPLC